MAGEGRGKGGGVFRWGLATLGGENKPKSRE